MTLEYTWGGSQYFSVYRFIDNELFEEQSFTGQSAGPAPLLPDPVSNPIGYWVILASKGDVNAMHQLGNIYEQREDKSSAKRWYGRAAKQGHRISQEAMSRLRE